MQTSEIQELIQEIKSIRNRLETAEQKLQQLLEKQVLNNKSTRELQIGSEVIITNKVTVYCKVRKRIKTDTIGKVIGFTNKFVRVSFKKNQFFEEQKGETSVLRKAKFLKIICKNE